MLCYVLALHLNAVDVLIADMIIFVHQSLLALAYYTKRPEMEDAKCRVAHETIVEEGAEGTGEELPIKASIPADRSHRLRIDRS